jgi:hypothetical protein
MRASKIPSVLSIAVLLVHGGDASSVPRARRAAAPVAHTEPPVEVEVATVVPSTAGMIVLLKTKVGERYLPIWVGEAEALAISLRLAHQQYPRPLTHDLLQRVIETLDAHVIRVTVIDLRDQTFIGQVDLRSGRREHHLDARSSDSIAIALGTGAPIFVAKHVLDAAGLDRATLERDGYQGTPVPLPLDVRHTL